MTISFHISKLPTPLEFDAEQAEVLSQLRAQVSAKPADEPSGDLFVQWAHYLDSAVLDASERVSTLYNRILQDMALFVRKNYGSPLVDGMTGKSWAVHDAFEREAKTRALVFDGQVPATYCYA